LRNIDEVIDELKQKFRPTLVDKARKRLSAVKRSTPGHWIVEGDYGYGDYYPEYHVMLDGKIYRCDCQSRYKGEHRNICSHILAIILWRKLYGDYGGGKIEPEFDRT